jgi:elongation factor G
MEGTMAVEIESIRNVAFISHGGAGKTSLVEAILFNGKLTNRLGSVDNGTSIMDFDQVEIERKISINAKLCTLEWNKTLLNILDTPGYGNFLHETKAALSVVDSAILIASAITGVKAETERVWDYSEQYGLSKIIFINKMDKERANFFKTIGDIEKSFDVKVVPIMLPIGKEESFKGVIDLIKNVALLYDNEGIAEYKIVEIPNEYKDQANNYRNKLIEAICDINDDLLERYLEGEDINEDEIRKAVREATITKRFTPVMCGSAIKNIGAKLLLEAIINFLPSPIEREFKKAKKIDNNETILIDPKSNNFSAYVFKTFIDPFAGKLTLFRVYSGELENDMEIYNVNKKETEKINQLFLLQGKNHIKTDTIYAGQIAMVNKLKTTETFDTLCKKDNPIIFDEVVLGEPVITFSLEPKSKDDEERVSNALHRLTEEDKSIKISRDQQSGELLISGMGQMHIETIIDKLKKKFNVEVYLKTPKVPYKETIKKSAKGQGKYKKQSGGRGQYGDVWIEIQPAEKGSGFKFIDNIVGGAIPKNYIPSVEKGIIEAAKNGVLAGFPMVDFTVLLYDGSYHTVDSSDLAFKIAASMAFKSVAAKADPVILEPIMIIDVFVPEDTVGAVIGDLNARRGRIENVEPHKNGSHIRAKVPMSEILKYAPDLRSMTGGRGFFTMEFSHYDEVPPSIAEKIIEAAEKEQK